MTEGENVHKKRKTFLLAKHEWKFVTDKKKSSAYNSLANNKSKIKYLYDWNIDELAEKWKLTMYLDEWKTKYWVKTIQSFEKFLNFFYRREVAFDKMVMLDDRLTG